MANGEHWTLAVDFGTTYTVGAVFHDGLVTLVDDENGSTRIPSAVWLDDDGKLTVGEEAVHQAVLDPSRFEPTPKRQIPDGGTVLGGELFEPEKIVSAILAKVASKAREDRGGTMPGALRLTHPVAWTTDYTSILIAAAELAHLPEPELIPEPVAAAYLIGAAALEPGQHVAVYDFGGGTFDAAVLRRTADTFQLAGPPGGIERLGGEDIDQAILSYVGTLASITDDPQWELLLHPPDDTWRRHRARLREAIRSAKQILSTKVSTSLWIPGLERPLSLTRDELNELIKPTIDKTLECFRETIDDAECPADQLAGIYLAGGSSRIPLVAAAIWREFARKPDVHDDPKSVVAKGAAIWHAQTVTPATRLRSRLAMRKRLPGVFENRKLPRMFEKKIPGILSWSGLSDAHGRVILSGEGLEVRVNDLPAAGRDASRLAAEIEQARWAKIPGYQEQSLGPATVLGRDDAVERTLVADVLGTGVAWLERYVVVDERAIVIRAPRAARHVADAVQATEERFDPTEFHESCLSFDLPAGWEMNDRLELLINSEVRVRADSTPVVAGLMTKKFAETHMRSRPGTALGAASSATLFDRPDAVMHARREDDGRQTRYWFLVEDGRGYVVTVKLDEHEGLGIPAALNHPRKHAHLADAGPSAPSGPNQPSPVVDAAGART